MRIAAALLLGTLAAGCNAPAPQQTVQQNDAARAEELKDVNGWDRVFGAPDAAIGGANQFGFRPTPYAAEGTGFASKGGPVMVAGSMSKTPNTASFAARGAAAGKIDTILFSLSIGDQKTAKDARKRFAAIVRDYLFQSKIEADALMPALEQGVAARGDLTGTPYAIDADKDRVAITFTRNGAEAPANSKPQGN
ncbi:hypothetical protein ACFQ1E_10095 [Sphingomonas canadensis]|uniref:Uncharacterized protein n=1 Tax=Sphingomonas canadensis TaxID=1219257 RepID=A0ABW3HBL4_9SPHN|nr:hypothetical protein [Sphingomonas canadensis]MCW3836530.1 hypothetical protein [Sphingomonas canadensis]